MVRKYVECLEIWTAYLRWQPRMRDGVLKRLIGKWPGTDAQLWSAGVMEDGNVSYPDSGSPQGGVVSPILSNVFLHYVLDAWCGTHGSRRR